jgi:uncharacterized phage-associated protein
MKSKILDIVRKAMERHLYSNTESEGYEYVDGQRECMEEISAELDKLQNPMLETLKEIAKGQGRYAEDKLRHCANAVEDMMKLAEEAIKQVESF